MRRWVGRVVLGLLCLAPVGAAGPATQLSIEYSGFAQSVRVVKSVLDYSWLQQTATPKAGRLELKPDQVGLFENWIGRYGVFALKNPDVRVGDPNHPGAAENSFLLVSLGDRKLELSWTGVSVWNKPEDKEKLDKALDELNALCIKLLKDAGLFF